MVGGEVGRGGDQLLQRGDREREDDAVRLESAAVDLDAPALAAAHDALGRAAAAHVGAERGQAVAQRLPERLRHRACRQVEDEPLAVPDEVVVEHHQELAGRHLLLRAEEGVGEDVEQHAARGGREAERVEVRARRDRVPAAVGLLHVEGEHGERRPWLDAEEIARAQGAAAQRQRGDVPGRAARQAGEGLLPVAAEDRIVLGGCQRGELRVDAAQEAAQVVVLPEEAVEPALHVEAVAAGELIAPRRGATAQVLLALAQRDAHAALGQDGGGRQPRDAAADDDGRLHAGRLARNEWTTPRCQPVIGWVATSVKPAARRRASKARTPSKASTLRWR